MFVRGTHCIPTKARHTLEGSLEADLLQAKVAVPEQTTPKEHPVQTGAVVHDDHAALPGNEAITCYHHLHPKHQLQQRLEGRRETLTPLYCLLCISLAGCFD